MVATTLQTLDRGLAVLATLADAPLGLKPAELAQRLRKIDAHDPAVQAVNRLLSSQ